MRAATRQRLHAGAILSAPLLWTLLFLFVPYVIMFTYSFYEKKFPLFVPAFQFGNYLTVFTDPQYYQVLVRTAKIAFLVGFASLLVAYPLTYFLVFKVRSARLRTVRACKRAAPAARSGPGGSIAGPWPGATVRSRRSSSRRTTSPSTPLGSRR